VKLLEICCGKDGNTVLLTYTVTVFTLVISSVYIYIFPLVPLALHIIASMYILVDTPHYEYCKYSQWWASYF
jgi:hypothetical protein